MKISYNWLKELVDIKKDITPKEISSKLLLHTVEVENVEKIGEILSKVVVGKILECKKHPDADRLSLTKVDIGKEKKLSIVCGAPNVAKGQKVAVALPGVTLPNGLTLEKRKVRGEASEGMICAADELGLGSDHAGIMVLEENLKVGKKLSSVIKMDDVIFEIDNKSLSHRPDLWGHLGMAREIGAIFNKKLKDSKFKSLSAAKKKESLSVKVKDRKLCPRYIGAVIENIKIGPTPEWLRLRLESVGVRSINNIVDITNYVMLELGQPMHAFSSDKLDGGIVVRSAKSGEKIETLDGEKRKLDSSMLVIADKQKPIAVAGVMGGANTEVDNDTTTIILESANFDFVSVRKTATKLGLRTESSMRFEKGLDPTLAELAIKRAMSLIAELIPEARLVNKIVDEKKFKLDQGPIKLDLDYLNRKIGENIPQAKVLSILKGLGFETKGKGRILSVRIPTWRATKDVAIVDDLVEEVARIYGYDSLESKMPEVSMIPPEVNRTRVVERKIKNILINLFGMAEVHNYSFTDSKDLDKAEIDSRKCLSLKNSIAENLSHLRNSLVPSLISNISHNQHFFDKIRIFELGLVFKKEKGEWKEKDSSKKFLPKQENYLTGTVFEKNNDVPFYKVKDIVSTLLKGCGIKEDLRIVKDKSFSWSNGARSLKIFVGKDEVGIITELNKRVQNTFGVKGRVGIFEINFDKLVRYCSEEVTYEPIPRYPAIELDLSIILPHKVLWQDVLDSILKIDSDIIKSVHLFDAYEGKGTEEGEKSLAFRVTYLSEERTLKLEEVKEIEKKILKILENNFKAKLRA